SSIPPGATTLTEIKLHGLTHTYIGDLQFVLDDPAGNRHNFIGRPSGGCDFNGDYNVVESGSTAWPTCVTLTPGTYDQYDGGWPAGTNNVDNARFHTIPAAVGNWKLT